LEADFFIFLFICLLSSSNILRFIFLQHKVLLLSPPHFCLPFRWILLFLGFFAQQVLIKWALCSYLQISSLSQRIVSNTY
jgi:hypothetical protein